MWFGATIWIVRLWLPDKRKSLVLAVLASSLIFSWAHYVGTTGETFHWFSFSFRAMAGMFFAVLFIYRGFGITAGAHAFFDILLAFFR
jgi:membrane protease YdiL (CAAX protease family)